MPTPHKQTCCNCKKEYMGYIDKKRCKNNFCSRKCLALYRSKYMSGENAKLYNPTIKICEICKKKYKTRKGRNLKFCSRKCMGVYYCKENNPCWRGGISRKYLIKKCLGCNKKISLYAKRCKSCCQYRELGYNWLGGISREPYGFEFDQKLKNYIRKIDNYVCQGCWKSEKEELEQVNRKLSIHHIDYNKKNNNPYNLITTCGGCNSKANKNRNYWTKFYKSIIYIYPRSFQDW